MNDEPPIFTVGHSARSIPEFADLLRCGPASLVVDVRTVARSRRNPQFNEDVLGAELGEFQLGYTRIPALGGLRGRSTKVPKFVNAFWENDSFHNYADHALSPEFSGGLAELLDLSLTRPCAIMCAESVWWRCHRRIIADYLLARGKTVLHLMGSNRIDQARLTPDAKIMDDKIIYPGRR